MKTLLTAMTMFAVLVSSAALANKEVGNGGDTCERRFQTVRNDLKNWLDTDGPASLQLPAGVSLAQYRQVMQDVIVKATVSCVSEPVRIGASEKTCINNQNEKGGARILCNETRFLDTAQSDQYVLVHHEYAGLAGFERNESEESKYSISSQISAFLADETVKRLVIKPLAPQPSSNMKTDFGDFVGNYEIVSCQGESTRGKSKFCLGHTGAEIQLRNTRDFGQVAEVVFTNISGPDQDLVGALTFAREQAATGEYCGTFYGKQTCEGETWNERNGAYRYSTAVTLRKIDGLTYLDWQEIVKDDFGAPKGVWTASLVLRQR